MDRLTTKEKVILAVFVLALVEMVWAIVELATGGTHVYDVVQLALCTMILSRVL